MLLHCYHTHFTQERMAQNVSHLPKVIPLWSDGIYSTICWLQRPRSFPLHHITSSWNTTKHRPTEVNLGFYWFDLWFHGRSVVLLCAVLFALKCSVLWQRTEPAPGAPWQRQLWFVSASQHQQMLPIKLAQHLSSKSVVTPTLLLLWLFLVKKCREIILQISASLARQKPTRTRYKLKSSCCSWEA